MLMTLFPQAHVSQLTIRYWMMLQEVLEIQTRIMFIVTVQVQAVNPQTGKEALGTGW